MENEINEALSEFDFSHIIHETVREYNWWEEIEDKVKDELKTEVDRAGQELSRQIDKRFDSPEFKVLVKTVMVEIITEKVAAIRQRVKDTLCWPWRKLVTACKRG